MIARVVFLCLFLWSVPGLAQPIDSNLIQMRLTHTLYQGFFAASYEENKLNPDLRYHANKVYSQIFLNTWSQMIESGKYRSTKEIFETISRGQGYLAKYYLKWQALHDFGSPYGRMDLGNGRNQLIAHVYNSETQFPNLDQRISYIMDMANTHLVAGHDFVLAELIAQTFLNSENPNVSRQANNLLNAIPFQTDVVQPIQLGFSILSLWRGYAGGANLAKPAFMSYEMAKPVQLSVLFHGALLGGGLLFIPEQIEHTGSKLPTSVNVGQLWDGLSALYNKTFQLYNRPDFIPSFVPETKQQVYSNVMNHLEHKSKLEYGDTFLSIEKLQRLDKLNRDDLFALDFAKYQYDQLKENVRKIFGRGPITSTQLEQFRALVIKSALSSYKRDYSSLLSTFLDWGGNSVAQTMLMIALLEPYQQQLPRGTRLVVSSWPGHLEAGLWDGVRFSALIQGKVTTEITGTLYKPEYILIYVLKHYPSALGDTYPSVINNMRMSMLDLIIKQPNATAEKSMKEKGPGGSGKQLQSGGDPKGGGKDGKDAKSRKSEDAQDDQDDKERSGTLNYSQMTQGFANGDIAPRLSAPQSSPADDRPKVTISINYEPRQYMFKSFAYDRSKGQLIVFNEAIYNDFVSQRLKSKMSDHALEEVIKSRQFEDLMRALRSPLIEKIYTKPSKADSFASSLNALLQIADSDLTQLDRVQAEIQLMLQELSLRNSNPIDFGGLVESLTKANEKLKNPEMATSIEIAKVIAAGEIRFLKNILRDPRPFLEMYNETSMKLRIHLLVRYFGASYWHYNNRASGNNEKLTGQAKYKIREFLANVQQIKVDFSREVTFICNPIVVNAPVASENLVWPYQFSPSGCQQAFKEWKEKTPQLSSKTVSGEASPDEKDMITLKVSTLIELTVGFGTGLQLWTNEIILAFVKGYYQEIGPSRAQSIETIKAIYLSDPAYFENPKYKSLETLWTTEKPSNK